VQTAINSLVVFCLLGLVVLMVVLAALLRDVRALQSAMADVAPAPRRQVAAFASTGGQPADTYVLVVSAHCNACEGRARALAGVDAAAERRTVLLSADASASAWVAGSPVETVIDPFLLGELGVDVTPLLLRYDADGNERFRRPVGSDDDLHRLLATSAA
jgi:hypothetical protein